MVKGVKAARKARRDAAAKRKKGARKGGRGAAKRKKGAGRARGRRRGRIVDPFANERMAAMEIRDHIEKISGVKLEIIAAGTTPDAVARFEASSEAKDRVADLIHREKTTGLTPDETSELDHFVKLEHVMRLAKARARSHGSK